MSRVAYKELLLIPPEAAVELTDGRLPAEAPVFVSPYLPYRLTCVLCWRDYLPLVYAPGQRTRAHHFHPGTGRGGIYHHHCPVSPQFGWLGEGRCSGRCQKATGNEFVRHAPSMFVEGIFAVCVVCRGEIERGVLALQAQTGWEGCLPSLYPLCRVCKTHLADLDWEEWGEFIIEGGVPLFSQTRKEVIAR